MITFYYEVKMHFGELEPGIYKSNFDGPDDAIHRHPPIIANPSERIWEEKEDGRVMYVKNRHQGPGVKVDLEEFMWIKLSARQI